MRKILLNLFLLITTFVYGQDMGKSETISYINNKIFNRVLSIDNQGIIKIEKTTKNSISGTGIFYYKDVEIDYYPFHPFQVRFKCKNSNECIEKLDYNPNFETTKTKYTNMLSISFEDKEEYLRVTNAFKHLFKILESENLKKNNDDFFSPENYKK